MNVKDLVNSCLMLWGKGLFTHNNEFRIIIKNETSEKEYSPWEDEYFYKEHNDVVDYWFTSDINHLHIKIK